MSPDIFRSTSLQLVWKTIKPYMAQIPYRLITTEIIRLGAAVTIMWVALNLYRRPEQELTQLALKYVMFIGLVSVLVLALKSSRVYQTLLHGMTGYIVVLSFIGNTGDYFQQNAGAGVTVIFVILFLNFIMFCTKTGAREGKPQVQYAYGTGATRGAAVAVSEQDRLFIAAHEAGHAMVYAAFDMYPPGLEVVAKSKVDYSHSLGYVRDGLKPHNLDEKTMFEWHMLLLLAGNAGERSHTGHETLGSSEDNAKWLKAAEPYLSSLTRGVYYMKPETNAQAENNDRKVMSLKAEHQARIDHFFELNRDVHNEMVSVLQSCSTLKGEKLFVFLDRVVLPDDFPRPKTDISPC